MSTISRPAPVRTANLELALGGWLFAASALALSGVLSTDRPFLIAPLLFGPVLTLFVLHHVSAPFRERVAAIPTSVLLGLHVVRAPIGAAFLVLAAEGRLDDNFANVAGWGDIAAGLLAFAVLPFADASSPLRRRALLLANVVGLADILLVVANAQRILLFSDHPATMEALTVLPWSLLPTFLVPLVITSHVAVLARLRAASAGV